MRFLLPFLALVCADHDELEAAASSSTGYPVFTLLADGVVPKEYLIPPSILNAGEGDGAYFDFKMTGSGVSYFLDEWGCEKLMLGMFPYNLDTVTYPDGSYYPHR